MRLGALGTAEGGLPLHAVLPLVDRLAGVDDAPFLIQCLEPLVVGRARPTPGLAVRLVRAYREAGLVDRARDLSTALPASPTSWSPLEIARLATERAILCTIDGRSDHAEAELRTASRSVASVPRGTGLCEQLDVHLACAHLELRQNRIAQAQASLRLAENLAERVENGAWHVAVAMLLGQIAMRLSDSRTAAKHFSAALRRSTTHGVAAMRAHGNLAIAWATIGNFDDARRSAMTACELAGELTPGWRHADAYDVVATVEIAADRPLVALQALDDASAAVGEAHQPTLLYQLASHRALALAMLGRAQNAEQWLQQTEKLRGELYDIDPFDAQDFMFTRARTLEACGAYANAIAEATPYVTQIPEAFATAALNVVVGRCALALGDFDTARAAVERAALAGDRYGWALPERQTSAMLWHVALKGGDSRIVRYAERMLDPAASVTATAPPSVVAISLRSTSVPPPSWQSLPSLPPPSRASLTSLLPVEETDATTVEVLIPDAEALIYVTTTHGVMRVKASDLHTTVEGADVIVNTITHQLNVQGRCFSLERRRTLEPLIVQLLRRAREGLTAEDILRAAGGPGLESADAEHRVRVLVSRLRDLVGGPASIERLRDAGEHGRTRYRISPSLRFALIEPLYAT